MDEKKREMINGIIVLILGMIIAIAAIVTEDGSVDDMAGWECEK